jgi:hypothetical protein
MGKGSSPAGQITKTQTDAMQQAQEPFMRQMWGGAQSLYQNNPMQYYPGQTLTQWGQPEKLTGYWDQYRAADTIGGMQPGVNAAFQSAVGGGYGAANNPANQYYGGFASGEGYPQQNFQDLQAQALSQGSQYAQQIGQYANPMMQYAGQAAANNNLGLSQLGNTASGMYLNSNPYMAQMVQSAMDPVTRNYQTSIAPSTDAMFSGGGRYGSGAMANAASTGQQNLARGLSDLSGNLYGQQYARERQAQDAAAQQYGSLYNAGVGMGMTGAQNAANIQNAAGNQYFQGQNAAQSAANQYAQGAQYGTTGLNSMFNTGNQAAQEALRMYPQFAQAQYIAPQGKVAAGTGMAGVDQAYLQDQMQRYYGMQNAPYDTLSKYAGYLGNPLTGTGTSSQPYFQNKGAEAMSGITGALGIAKTVAPMLGKI